MVTKIAWSQGPNLGFSGYEYNLACGAPYDFIHGPHVENHMGPTLDPIMKYKIDINIGPIKITSTITQKQEPSPDPLIWAQKGLLPSILI